MSFLNTIRSTIERHRMLHSGDRVLIGVSGGPDSVALLVALVALRDSLSVSLRAAYVDHGARPTQTGKEAALVKRLGRLYGVKVSVVRRSVRKKPGESWEEAARILRYDALTQLARKYRCHAIAMGHTQNDQAETVLLWLLRGTGTSGLAGIPPVREVKNGLRHLKIIRPLLHSSRGEVELFLESHRIHSLQDQSNQSDKFLRNRIRRELIPFLERRYNPKIRSHLAQLAQIVREDVDWLKEQAIDLFEKSAQCENGSVGLSRRRLRKTPSPLRRRVLRCAVERLNGDSSGFGARHWISLEELLLGDHSKGIDLPHGIRAQIQDRDWFVIRRSGTLRKG